MSLTVVMIFFIFIGILAGLSAGLFGSGGGMVVVPLLTFVLLHHGIPIVIAMHVAVGTSLAIMVMTSLSSALSHHQHNGVRWKIIEKMLLGLVLGSVAGSIGANLMPGHMLYFLFALFVLFSAVQLAFDWLPRLKSPIHTLTGFSTFGAVTGFVSSVLGIGGSTLTVPFLIMNGVPMKSVAGTTSVSSIPIALIGAVIFIVAGLGSAGLPYGSIGFLNFPAFTIIGIISMFMAHYSAKFSYRFSPRTQQRSFAIFLFVIAIFMGLHVLKFWQLIL